jgi:chitin disaccharide deacetylase
MNKEVKHSTGFRIVILCFLVLFFFESCAQDKEIRLIVRADDIGAAHSINEACIEVYKNGIARSVEIMVPCPWYPEAVKMLKEVPGYDVGIHLTMTSEWENVKWGPVTHAPGLTDEDGYFYPTYWAGENFTEAQTLTHNDWTPEEVEQELRAQIEKALKDLPGRISHMGIHMGGAGADPRIAEIQARLAEEYGLVTSLEPYDVKRFDGFKGAQEGPEMIKNLMEGLENIEPGTYLFIDHPAYDTPEIRALGHKGYWNVAENRDGVTKAWTDPRVKEVISRRGIQLISYGDLINSGKSK